MREEKENPSFVASLARDTKKGSDDAAGLPDRLTRYSRAHHRALDMADYIRKNVKWNQFQDIPALLKHCGSYLVFHDYYNSDKIRLAGMHSCKKHMLCPLCAIRRGAKMLKAYLDRLDVIRSSSPGLKAFLVTFTVKNGDDLLERFNHLQDSLQKYNDQRRNGIKGQRLVEYNKSLGSVGSFEFKMGANSGKWHPHFHSVWLCYDAPCPILLSNEWQSITGDSFIVDVTPFYDQEDVVSGFLEVFKYALKFSDLPMDQNWHGFETLSGKRLVSSFGVFRGVKVPKEMTDDLFENEPFVELFYNFERGTGYNFTSSQ